MFPLKRIDSEHKIVHNFANYNLSLHVNGGPFVESLSVLNEPIKIQKFLKSAQDYIVT